MLLWCGRGWGQPAARRGASTGCSCGVVGAGGSLPLAEEHPPVGVARARIFESVLCELVDHLIGGFGLFCWCREGRGVGVFAERCVSGSFLVGDLCLFVLI